MSVKPIYTYLTNTTCENTHVSKSFQDVFVVDISETVPDSTKLH